MTGVLPNLTARCLRSFAMKNCAHLRNEVWRPLLPFGSGSNLEKRRIIYEIAADLPAHAVYFHRAALALTLPNGDVQHPLQAPRLPINSTSLCYHLALCSRSPMNDRFVNNVSAPPALSDMPVALMANAIRALAMDAVQQANSGHPGMPMGMAEIAVALWGRHLSHNPANPHWANRDRFVLSNGHGSMLQYALLHLTGYDLPLQELRNFRQLHSRTPGHPELGLTPGVETTTGPLGQGFANAVGMALAEKLLAAEFNRPAFDIVDHWTYVFDGRRLHDGRHFARSRFARRHVAAEQADR